MDTAGYGGVGKRSGRGGAIPIRRPALSALSTLGETGRTRFPITARVADPSRLWAMAFLSRSACLCGVDLAAGPIRGGQSLRRLRRKAMPGVLSRRRIQPNGLRRAQMHHPFAQR